MGAKEASIISHPGEDEIRGLSRGIDEILPPDDSSRLGHRADHEAVPAGEDLVIGPRLLTLIPNLEQGRVHTLGTLVELVEM